MRTGIFDNVLKRDGLIVYGINITSYWSIDLKTVWSQVSNTAEPSKPQNFTVKLAIIFSFTLLVRLISRGNLEEI